MPTAVAAAPRRRARARAKGHVVPVTACRIWWQLLQTMEELIWLMEVIYVITLNSTVADFRRHSSVSVAVAVTVMVKSENNREKG